MKFKISLSQKAEKQRTHANPRTGNVHTAEICVLPTKAFNHQMYLSNYECLHYRYSLP